MRNLSFFAGVLVLLAPPAASAQPPLSRGTQTDVTEVLAAGVQLRRPPARPPFVIRRHGSIKKAALTGAAVGALGGIMFVGAQCENHCEAGSFAASMAYFGALGAESA